MNYYKRTIEAKLQQVLKRGKSVLLLGARQTGKTTILKNCYPKALYYNLAIPKERRRFEQNPDSLAEEIIAVQQSYKVSQAPLVIIDEVQKVPDLMDVAQYLIDNKQAQFILTGSSARKLKHRENAEINLLPGRVIKLQLDPLNLREMSPFPSDIKKLLLYGSLPHVFFESSDENKEDELLSYVDLYLEEEVRQEALVRNLGAFSRFLELAAIEAGNTVNLTNLSKDIGVNVHLITEYFQILEDCLILDKITAVTQTNSRKRLIKTPKYLFFDLGVRRLCAKEGTQLSQKTMGNLFEQYVGIEINRHLRTQISNYKLQYWRDHNGPEVDYVINMNHRYLPIEVKCTQTPDLGDARHLLKFMNEYPCQDMGYIICQASCRQQLSDQITAIPWQELSGLLEQHLV